MKVCCEYCGQYFPETEERCPHCGAPNSALTRSGRAVPRTIEELKLFCASHNLPLEQMRFFIGEDYRGARAVGIYKDEHGVCTVRRQPRDPLSGHGRGPRRRRDLSEAQKRDPEPAAASGTAAGQELQPE